MDDIQKGYDNISGPSNFDSISISQFIPDYPLLSSKEFLPELFSHYEINELASRHSPRRGETEKQRRGREFAARKAHQDFLARYINNNTPYNGVLVYHAMGTGKCVHPETKITVYGKEIRIDKVWKKYSNLIHKNGNEQWSNLRSPVMVKSFNGTFEYSTVTHLFRQRVEESIVNLKLRSGRKIRCTKKHKFLVNGEWTLSGEIKPGDKVLTDGINEKLALSFISIVRHLDEAEAAGEGISFKKSLTKEELNELLVKCVDKNWGGAHSVLIQRCQDNIESISYEKYKGWVYDLEVEDTHCYVANGIVSHNTCAAIKVAEEMMKMGSNLIPRAKPLILAPERLLSNFKLQLLDCGKGEYKGKLKPGEDEEIASLKLNPQDRIKRRTAKNIKRNFALIPARTFLNHLRSGRFKASHYDNRLIVIDEVHTYKPKDKIKGENEEEELNYKALHTFLHKIKNCKIVLLSGTPMSDSVEEISDVMNLLLPLDKQLPTGKSFRSKFLKANFTPKLEWVMENQGAKNKTKVSLKNKEELVDAFLGRVSYYDSKLRFSKTYVKKGKQFTKYLETYGVEMSPFQSEAVAKAHEQNQNDTTHRNTRLSCIFVWPDGTIGKEAIDKKYYNPAVKSLTINKFAKELKSELWKYSAKFDFMIETIANNPDKVFFAYFGEMLTGGADIFACLLKLKLGMVRANAKNLIPGERRFAYFASSETKDSEILAILEKMKSKDNNRGQLVSVIIGTTKVALGLSFHSVTEMFVVSPPWNDSMLSQAQHRVLRSGSLNKLDDDQEKHVNLYNLNALSSHRSSMTIDNYIYCLIELKKMFKEPIIGLMRSVAVDCAVNYLHNSSPSDCETRSCSFSCYGMDRFRTEGGYESTRSKKDVYNLLYADHIKIKTKEALITELRESGNVDIKTFISSREKRGNVFVTLSAVYELIQSRTIIFTKLGLPCYVQEKNGTLFLSLTLQGEDKTKDLYAIYPMVTTQGKSLKESFQEHALDVEYQAMCDFLKDPTEERYSELSQTVKLNLFGFCYPLDFVFKETKYKVATEPYKHTIYDFEGVVLTTAFMDGVTTTGAVSGYKTTLSMSDWYNLKILEGDKFSYVDRRIADTYIPMIKEEGKAVDSAAVFKGITGMITVVKGEEVFKIKSTGKGRGSKGRACKSYDDTELIAILKTLEHPNPENIKKSELCNEVKKVMIKKRLVVRK